MPASKPTPSSLAFLLSDVFSRYFDLLSTDFQHLLSSSSDIPDIALKIARHFPICEGTESIFDLRTALYLALRAEVSELGDSIFVRYFVDSQKINSFFAAVQHMLENRDEENDTFWDFEQNNIGYYNGLRCIELCKNFGEMKTFGLRDSGIERFFEGVDTVEMDCQKAYLLVSKKYYEKYYLESKEYPEFREIIIEEIKMSMGELYLSRGKKEMEQLSEFIPVLNGPDDFYIDSFFRELCIAKDADGVKKLMGLGDVDICDGLRMKRIQLYKRSFDAVDNLSAIYSFIQLRNLQIREILFIVEENMNGE